MASKLPSQAETMNRFAKLHERTTMGLYDEHLIEGERMTREAEKALKQSTLFATFPKLEDGIQFYNLAAEAFRRSKRWEEAGDCYFRIADLEKNLGDKHAAAMAEIDCAAMYDRFDQERAIGYYQTAIATFAELGRFTQAGKYQEHVGLTQLRHDDALRAIQSFQQASDYYIADGQHMLANRCLSRVAELCAIHERYDRAAETFEALGLRSLQFNMLRFNAKTYFFRAGLCIMAKNDPKQAQRARRRHKDLDFMFGSMAECKFLEDIGVNMREGDLHGFADHLYNFNNVIKLTPFELTIMIRVKDHIAVAQYAKEAKEEQDRLAWIEANKKKKKR